MAAATSRRTAAVVGAGIGGLAAAIALRGAGWKVSVLERDAELRPLGAGLSIWPNGVIALRSLGLGHLADGSDVPRSGGALRRADGSILASFDPRSIEDRFGAPLVGIHRRDLQDALLDAQIEPPRLGIEVTSIVAGAVRTAGGDELPADLIVGADGLRSVVRESVLGAAEPIDSGIVAFRGVAESPSEVPAGEMWGAGCVAGLLPLAGGVTYWYVAFSGAAGDRAALEARITGFSEPLPEIVRSTDPAAVLSHRLFDRDPAPTWSGDAITLLGDAAHPMLPFLGQGACSALEDAVALGAALDGGEIGAGLSAYEAKRSKRAALLVRRSRSAAKVALTKSALGRGLRDRAVSWTPETVRLRQLAGIVAP